MRGNPLWAVSLRALAATRDRPLFSASRRPPPPVVFALASVPAPPPATAKPAEPDHPQLALIGTVTGGTRSIGIFMEEESKNALRLRPGEAYGGWMLRAVKRGEASFERDGRVATLSLPPAGGPQPVPAGAGRTGAADEGTAMRGDEQQERRR
jgi:general secretion pathway protein N